VDYLKVISTQIRLVILPLYFIHEQQSDQNNKRAI